MSEIVLPNPENFEDLKKKFVEGGLENFHVVADFDRTLTKCFVGDKKSSTSWAQFRNLGIFDEDYFRKSNEMFEFYRPIEVSFDISSSDKIDKMSEWWQKHLQLLVDSKISREIILEVVNRGGIEFRRGALEFLDFLREKKIPLVIMSSGLGDIIVEVLKKEDRFYENIFIVSNFFEWDEEGFAKGFKGDMIIHSLNKSEVNVSSRDFFDKINIRKNVLLLSDGIDDVGMVEGFDYDNLIKVGFLNENVEGDLERYKKHFDIVITGDGDMNFVNEFLEGIK